MFAGIVRLCLPLLRRAPRVAGLGACAPPRMMEYTKSTEERYSTADRVFVGPYSATRATLDYDWHLNYRPERQAVQDGIVSAFLRGGAKVERPWLVYTAGAMGAGA